MAAPSPPACLLQGHLTRDPFARMTLSKGERIVFFPLERVPTDPASDRALKASLRSGFLFLRTVGKVFPFREVGTPELAGVEKLRCSRRDRGKRNQQCLWS